MYRCSRNGYTYFLCCYQYRESARSVRRPFQSQRLYRFRYLPSGFHLYSFLRAPALFQIVMRELTAFCDFLLFKTQYNMYRIRRGFLLASSYVYAYIINQDSRQGFGSAISSCPRTFLQFLFQPSSQALQVLLKDPNNRLRYHLVGVGKSGS